MRHDWMVDVLADLDRYARKHGLSRLSGDLRAAMTSAVNPVVESKGPEGEHWPLARPGSAHNLNRAVQDRAGDRR